jgi:hypothetical protein
MNRRHYYPAAWPALLSMVLISCGTIIHGTTQTIQINSTPPGATARVDGRELETPTSVSLARNKDYTVGMEKAGCEPGQANIGRGFNGFATIVGNLLWLMPGVLVDVLAGGAWTLEPETVHVELACPPPHG